MSKFNVGDKVRYTGNDHDYMPEYYPKIGTVGIIEDIKTPNAWVQWPNGSTSKNDCWCCPLFDIEKIDIEKIIEDMTNEEIWEMLKPKFNKNNLEGLYVRIDKYGYVKEDVYNAIAIAYRSGYERAMKGRPFKIGEKKAKKQGGHWEPIDPNNLPKEGTKVRYNGGLKGCNWKKNSEAKWIKTEDDRFSIKFDEMIWTLDYMNRLLKYFDVWVEDDE